MDRQHVDRAIAALAARQDGVVSRRQAEATGLSANAIDGRVQSGRLWVVFRGVYAVGHPSISRGGRLKAAVLACGEGAVLSHDSAAEWWRLQGQWSRPIEVSVPVAGGRDMAGIRIHRTPHLRPSFVTRHRGIPITTVERTILDRAARNPRRTVERDLDEAHRLRLYDRPRLEAILEERKGRAGTATLRTVLAEHTAGSTWTRNDFEEAFLRLIDDAHLPRPLANHRVGRYVLDFHWPNRGLAVECDGRATHLTPKAFEDDRARDTDLWVTHATHVIRFTYRQVTRERATTMRRLRGALAQPSG